MTTFEIAFNILGAGVFLAGLLYTRLLLRTAGRARLDNPALVKQLHETAPYHRLSEVMDE